MAGNIFINYRRDDSSGVAGRLHDVLAPKFGRNKLFMDVDNIPVGKDFEDYLNSQVAACDAMLAIIGPNWLTAKDETGQRRLDKPDDFIVIEIGAALVRNIPVVPVLVDGAGMPKASELPDSLKPLARRQAIQVRHTNFNSDADGLVKRLREALGYDSAERRWGARVAIGVTAMAVLLLIGWGGYTWFRQTVERGVQQAEVKREQEQKAAEAEAKRKVEEAERQRQAEQERDRKATAAREAEEKLKAQEAEKKGLAAANSGDSDGAIANYNEAIRLDPKSAVAFYNRGVAYSNKRDYDKAIADYNEAVRLGYTLAFVNRGNAYYMQRDYDKAIADYNEAIRISPNNSMALRNRGLVYNERRDYDKAIADYNEAIRLEPQNAVYFNTRGVAYSNKRDYDKAIADYNEAIRRDPYFALAFNNRGWAYMNKDDHNKAIADYSEAIRLDPQNAATPFFNRAFAYSRMDDHDKAIADYNEVLRLSPNSAYALCNRGRAKLKINEASGSADIAKARQIDYNACPL